MNLFRYKAVDATGRAIFGRIEALNDADLELRLGRMGLDLINFRTIKPGGFFNRGHKVRRRELITFLFHLEQLSRAGVPLLESLRDLRGSLPNPQFRNVVAELIEDIEAGQTLSGALGRFPVIFDHVFVSLVRAGEQSGKLPEIFRELIESLKWQDELAAQTKKVLMYPAFIGVVVLGVIFFLMTYLVPQLVGFIQNMNQEIPFNTRVLIAVSRFFTDYWYIVLLTPVGGAILLFWLARISFKVRYRLDDLKLKLWLVGDILSKIILARIANNFGLLYSTGIPVLQCLQTAEGLANNLVIQGALQRASLQIADGVGLSAGFENTGLFPPLVLRMLRVGENTGALETALGNVSYFYERDVKESIQRLESMIEPVLTVLLGLLLGWVMLSVLGPIYNIISELRI